MFNAKDFRAITDEAIEKHECELAKRVEECYETVFAPQIENYARQGYSSVTFTTNQIEGCTVVRFIKFLQSLGFEVDQYDKNFRVQW